MFTKNVPSIPRPILPTVKQILEDINESNCDDPVYKVNTDQEEPNDLKEDVIITKARNLMKTRNKLNDLTSQLMDLKDDLMKTHDELTSLSQMMQIQTGDTAGGILKENPK